MRIDVIRAKNFLAWDMLEFETANMSNPTLIVGKTGHGKTSIFEALTVALFGKTMRKPGSLARLVSRWADECWIHVMFSHKGQAYQLTRTFTKNGGHSALLSGDGTPTVKGVTGVNDWVKRMFGITFELFMQTAYFSQSVTDRFMQESDAEKKELLEAIFGENAIHHLSERIDQALDYNKASIALWKERKYKAESVLDEQQQVTIHRPVEDITRDILKTKKRLTQFPIRRDAALTEMKSIMQGEMEVLRKVQDEYNACHSQYTLLLKGKCPTCESPFLSREKDIAKLKVQLRCLTTDADRIKRGIKNAEATIDRFSEARRSAEFNYREAEKRLAVYKQELELAKAQKEMDAHSIQIAQEIIEKADRKLAYREKKDGLLQVWKKACGKRGIIAFLLQRSLPFLEYRTNHYVTQMLPIRVGLSVDDTGKLITEIKHERGGESLSAGETRVVDFAAGLALHDLIKSVTQSKIDFLLLDEAPEHLDDETSELMAECIKGLPTKQTFVITHNRNWGQYFRTVVEVTKEGRKSTLNRVSAEQRCPEKGDSLKLVAT